MASCDSIFRGNITGVDYIYTIIASLVAGSGFMLDSETVIIGSMLISPLMKPMFLMFHKLMSQKYLSFFKNLGHLSAFGGIAICIGAIYGYVVNYGRIPVTKSILLHNKALTGRTLLKDSDQLYNISFLSIIAICCGIGLALSNYYDVGGFSGIIVGASISTSILPPLVSGGISFGIKETSAALSSILLSGLNLFLIFVSFGITEKILCK